MLQKKTLSKDAMELLKELMQDVKLNNFFLVGGTALALLIGHRKSIDLDLFSFNPFDESKMLTYLESTKGMLLNYQEKNTLKGQINNVQVDLIMHAYPLVKDLVVMEGIRLASLDDIAAMKLNAITGNGTRVKDFIDIAFLSSFLSLDQMLDAYEKKYQTRNTVIVLKSLDFFQDINHLEPVMLTAGNYSWKPIEKRLKEILKTHGKIFEPMSQVLKRHK